MVSFNPQERELVFTLAERLTGSCQKEGMRKEILVTNVSRRMLSCQQHQLESYLQFALTHEDEFEFLLSALTIHTTSWFREKPHFEILAAQANEFALANENETFRVWCSACSTGEEVYSFAAVLEQTKLKIPTFTYEILGSDVDPVSVKKARAALYSAEFLKDIPLQYRSCFFIGSGKSQNLMTLVKSLRERCKFEVRNLTKPEDLVAAQPFHFIICRNVLIYFSPEQVSLIIKSLVAALHKTEGALCLGHSESVSADKFGLELLSNCVYARARKRKKSAAGTTQKKVLVVDDSLTVRTLAKRVLESAHFEVICAENADKASELLKSNVVDAITLDVNMPGKDGLTWLAERRRAGLRTPVIVLSDANPETATPILAAMGDGAQDFVEKGIVASDPQALVGLVTALISPRPKAVQAQAKGFVKRTALVRPDVIVIGASTGGTEALAVLLKSFPKNGPPIVIVQHISAAFASAFANRLAATTGLPLGKFQTGTRLESGTLYIPTEDLHIEIDSRGGTLFLRTSDAPPVARHRPSVDTLFLSTVAARTQALGILLTGMGRDGARGLHELHKKGMVTCAQDEASSVVFGMPKEAIALGGASFIGNLAEIRRVIEDSLRSSPAPQLSKKAS